MAGGVASSIDGESTGREGEGSVFDDVGAWTVEGGKEQVSPHVRQHRAQDALHPTEPTCSATLNVRGARSRQLYRAHSRVNERRRRHQLADDLDRLDRTKG